MGPTDGPMDWQTDRPTDTVTYRVVCTQLKRGGRENGQEITVTALKLGHTKCISINIIL